MGVFQLKTSGNLVGEKGARPDWASRPESRGIFIPEELRRRFKRELESQRESQGESQPVLERVFYKTDEVKRTWPDLILIIMMI